MLITQLKAKESDYITDSRKESFIINCHGCKEVVFRKKKLPNFRRNLQLKEM